MTKFLTSLNCKACGQPMKLWDEDGGFTGGWSEEDRFGHTIAEHWSRSWVCECGVRAEEGAIDDDPYSDDPDADYLMPDGDPLSWYDKDGELEMPPELQHDGFYYTTPAGNTVHVQGNPNMSQEALDALSRMIDQVAKNLDEGSL